MSELIRNPKEALKKTAEFWQALSQTGGYKSELAKSDRRFAEFAKYHELCALCEYTKEGTSDFNTNCNRCLVDWAVFPSLVRTEFPDNLNPPGTCQHPSSPFRQWELAVTREGRKKWAREVANLAKRTLNNFKGENRMYIVIELHGGPEYATICTDKEGNNLVFELEKSAGKYAEYCQDAIVVEVA